MKDETISSQDIKVSMDKVLEDSFFSDKKVINIFSNALTLLVLATKKAIEYINVRIVIK